MTAAVYYNCMGNDDGTVWILDLYPKTQRDCERAISWQHVGGNYQPMWVCTYDKVTKEFVDTQSARRFPFPTTRSIYTEAAWSAFVERINAE